MQAASQPCGESRQVVWGMGKANTAFVELSYRLVAPNWQPN